MDHVENAAGMSCKVYMKTAIIHIKYVYFNNPANLCQYEEALYNLFLQVLKRQSFNGVAGKMFSGL